MKTIKDKIYEKCNGKTMHVSEIIKVYKPLRYGDELYAYQDVYEVVLNPLINLDKVKNCVIFKQKIFLFLILALHLH